MLTPSEVLDRIDALKAELDQLRPLDRELEERVLQKFRLWWTYHSNAIEGNKLTQGETEMFLMEGLTAKGKPLKRSSRPARPQQRHQLFAGVRSRRRRPNRSYDPEAA